MLHVESGVQSDTEIVGVLVCSKSSSQWGERCFEGELHLTPQGSGEVGSSIIRVGLTTEEMQVLESSELSLVKASPYTELPCPMTWRRMLRQSKRRACGMIFKGCMGWGYVSLPSPVY